MTYQYWITTIDSDGYCQPHPIAPDWPHISELLSQGWRFVRSLADEDCQEMLMLFRRPKGNHDENTNKNDDN